MRTHDVQRCRDIAKIRPPALYVACDDLDFSWTQYELLRVKEGWQVGKSIPDMAGELDREQDEIAILIMDLRRQGKIELREGGVWGGTMDRK